MSVQDRLQRYPDSRAGFLDGGKGSEKWGKRKGVRTGDCPENGTRPFLRENRRAMIFLRILVFVVRSVIFTHPILVIYSNCAVYFVFVRPCCSASIRNWIMLGLYLHILQVIFRIHVTLVVAYLYSFHLVRSH